MIPTFTQKGHLNEACLRRKNMHEQVLRTQPPNPLPLMPHVLCTLCLLLSTLTAVPLQSHGVIPGEEP